MTKEQIYDYMTIVHIVPHPEIPCEFDEGKPCMEMYEKVCTARERIAQRTGLDFEDKDLLEMMTGMEAIAKLCGLRMYEYGTKYGLEPQTKG